MLREFFFVLIFHFNIFACFQANLRASIVARMHPCAPSSWPRSRWEILITTSKTNTRSDIWVSLFGWPSFISLLGLILFCSKLQCRLSGDWRGHGSGCERQEQEIQLHKMINEQLPHLIKQKLHRLKFVRSMFGVFDKYYKLDNSKLGSTQQWISVKTVFGDQLNGLGTSWLVGGGASWTKIKK